MPMFRKKPVEVEARQCSDYDESLEIMTWCGGDLGWDPEHTEGLFYIPTLEGRMWVQPNDWVIKGVQGEFYPCKPDIFEKTYEAV